MSPIVRRSLLLVFAGASLYLLAPSLIEVFSSAPKLATIQPWWFIPMVVCEGASLAANAVVQRICLQTRRFRPVLWSSLAGNAVAKVVPGGGAAGGAMQYAMLVASPDLAGGRVASALTAANLLTFATLLALPVLTLPAVIGGAPVANGLAEAAWLGVAGFVVMALGGAALLVFDAPLAGVGSVVERVHNRVLSGRAAWSGLGDRLLRERDVVLGAVGRSWWQALLAAVGRWTLDYAVLVTALAAVGSQPRPSLVLLAYIGAQVLSQIPVTPGGLGFVEAGLTGLLALAGVGAADAALATLAYRLVSYWLPLPVGGLAAYVFRRGAPRVAA